MNADAFRHIYAYHFAENRTLWDTHIMPLTESQFVQAVPYSIGAVRDQVVHMMSVDDTWFADLSSADLPDTLNPADFTDRAKIRAHWDAVEGRMRAYLDALRDEALFTQPLRGEDKDLYVWQVLFHVANHGTDHRAQLLRVLHDLGAKTVGQDYVFYAYDHPVTSA